MRFDTLKGILQMPSFLVSEESIRGDEAVISGREFRHIARVMRMQVGDRIILITGMGGRWEGEIGEIGTQEMRLRILRGLPALEEPRVSVCLYQSLIAPANMELVIQKTTELGVRRIVPVRAERCVPYRVDTKIERWTRIAQASACQCGRNLVPRVERVMDFNETLQEARSSKGMLIFGEGQGMNLADALSGEHPSSVSIFIGSEGGFSRVERTMALQAGAREIWLGPRILRSETAAIAATALVLFHLGEMG